MLNTKSTNPNYLARVFVLPELKPHPNADRLLICNYLGNSIITSNSARPKELYIYCPLEGALNKEFLSFTNSFSDPELNADKTKKSFFCSAGRIKAVKLRGSKSEGYIFPASELSVWLKSIGIDHTFTENDVNKDFDSIGDVLFIEKYVNKQAILEARKEAKVGRKARESKIIDGQFYFHRDTSHLGREIHNISPNDLISWTEKYHGSSGISSKLLCKKDLKWYEKALKAVGINIVDKTYDYIWSSRRVVKSDQNSEDKNHYYDSDIWFLANEKVKNSLKDGISLYYEIVGYTPTGAEIQKDYDYSCEKGTLDVFIYRITYTSPSNDVFEFSWPQLKDYCDKFGLKYVKEHFYGYAKDLFPELDTNEHWHENFLIKLSEKYLEKQCSLCKNNVPNEGGVLRREFGNFNAFKHKSFLFKERASKELDNGRIDIEDIN